MTADTECRMTVISIPVPELKSNTWYYGVRCPCTRLLLLCEDLFAGKTDELEMPCSPAVAVACPCGTVTETDRLHRFKSS